MIRLCVLGASGRMGQQVLRLAHSDPQVELAGAVDREGAEGIGQAIEGTDLVIHSDLERALEEAEVYIDFTTPAATAEAAIVAARHKTAAVVGTTGLDQPAQAALAELAALAPVFVSHNFSPGVALLLHLAETAARALGPDYDMEVVELHHRNKVDSPSGTALALGQALATGRALDFERSRLCAREGQVGARTDDEIGLFAVRGGDIIGEHTAYLVNSEERLEITHRAQKRSVFASGAIRAAHWLSGQAPGHYAMSDMLGF